MNPWEQGSEFHWDDVAPLESEDPEQAFLARVAPLRFSSGRAALLGLLETLGPTRLWVPGYFCGEVVEALRAANVELARYADVPDRPIRLPDRAEPGDTVLVVNTFGARTRVSASSLQSRGILVLEDHTHDPSGAWAQTSDADWCLASLRKTLPVADGALLWSPRRHMGPREPALVDAGGPKLAAMLLKRMYLDGHAIDKSVFRALAVAGEPSIVDAPGMSVLAAALWPCLPLVSRRARRADNLAIVTARLSGRIRVIGSSHAILVFDEPEARERMREHLIAHRIYPAILWPADEESQTAERDFAARMLVIHVDARYRQETMHRVAATILDYLGPSVHS